MASGAGAYVGLLAEIRGFGGVAEGPGALACLARLAGAAPAAAAPAAAAPPRDAALAAKLLRQVEYYMCERSLPFDDYLQAQLDADGTVALSVLAGFPRVRKMTEDVGVLRAALAASDSVTVCAGGERVRRTHPLPDADPAAARTVHAENFARGCGEAAMRDVLSRFGAVSSLRRLRNLASDQRYFDGSCFAVYTNAADAEKAAAAEPPRVGDAGVRITLSAEWFRKVREHHKTCVPGGAGKRKRDGGDAGAKQSASPEKRARKRVERLPDALLAFSGFGGEATREEFKALCKEFGEVAWVDFSRGDTTATVRFAAGGKAAAAAAALNAKRPAVGGAPGATAVALTGDDEDAHWAALNAPGGGKGGKRGKGRKGGK